MNNPIAFILCKPDFLLRGLLHKFLSYLEEKDFYICEFLCARVTPDHFRLMYTNHFRYDVDDWHHNQKLYDFGPALGLLLVNYKVTSALEKLNQLKGAALPKNRTTDSIRYLFGSKSRLLNLLHVPDQLEQSYKESRNWFSLNKWKDQSHHISKEEVLKEIHKNGYYSNESLDPEYTYLKAKIRLMHSFQKRSVLSPNSYMYIQNLKQFYFNWAEEVAISPLSNGIEGTILPSWYKKEQNHLQALQNQKSLPRSILNAINLLLLLHKQPKFASNFFWVIEEWNVFIDDFERYLIASRLKYV